MSGHAVPVSEALEQQRDFLAWALTPEGVQWSLARATGGVADMASDPNIPPTREQMRMAEALQTHTIRAATSGETYCVVPEIVDVITEAAKSLPDWTLEEKDIPTRAGFCWFQKPIIVDAKLPPPPGAAVKLLPADHLEVKGIFWSFYYEVPLPMGNDVTMVVWAPEQAPASRRGMVIPLLHIGFLATAEDRIDGVPVVGVNWAIGRSLQASLGDFNEHAIKHYEVTQQDLKPNYDISQRLLRIAAALFGFLEQRILVTTKHQVSRAARRRLTDPSKVTEFPEINVVELRKYRYVPEDPSEPNPVDWSCRWIVSGHWRRQAVGPGRQDHRYVWIVPYVKGPPDRPLRIQPKIFAATR
jgi:hypothetical protein